MFGATNLSVKRKGGILEEVLEVIEGVTEDILLWPQNETLDTLRGTALCRAVQTLTCTSQVFSFLGYSVSVTAKKACATSNAVHNTLSLYVRVFIFYYIFRSNTLTVVRYKIQVQAQKEKCYSRNLPFTTTVFKKN